MKRPFLLVAATLALASLVLVGCGPAAPAPTPTRAPAPPTTAPAAPTKAAVEPTKPVAAAPAPTKAAEPTKPAPTVAPTAAPAKTTTFPEKGKTISFVVYSAAGGGNDLTARLLSPALEKELGVSVQVINKTGGGSQVGLTELVTSKPDGYTIGMTSIPTTSTTYLDPERKAVYNRQSFQAIARILKYRLALSVKPDSPYKELKDLVDAAKAKPEGIKIASAQILSAIHVAVLELEKAAGVKFAWVFFEGGGPGMTALLGGHVDASSNVETEVTSHLKAGTIRVLSIFEKEEAPSMPGIKTAEAQGYKAYATSHLGVSAPAGTPKEVVDILSAAFKKVLADPTIKARMLELGPEPAYLDAAEFGATWTQLDTGLMPLIEQSKSRNK